MRINRISAQAFRGFPENLDFTLSDGTTVVYAQNGSGKTSIAEAFEWALYGEVARKVRSKTPGEFGQNFLRSAHAAEGTETWAEVDLVQDDGSPLTIRRTMSSSGGSKLTANGEEIESVEAVGISTGPAFRPSLGQSEIKAFIDTQPIDRWQQISAILGLDGFAKVRDQLLALNTDTDKYEVVKVVRGRAHRAVAPLIADTEDPFAQEPEGLRRTLATELGITSESDWASIKAEADKKVSALLGRDKRPASLERLVQGPEEIEAALPSTIEQLESKLEEHRAWHDSNKHAKFISQGLPIAKPPTCPFCGESTLTDTKLASLGLAAAAISGEPEEINKEFNNQMRVFASLKNMPVNLTVTGSLADALGAETDLIAQLQALPSRQTELETKVDALLSLGERYSKATLGGGVGSLSEVKALGSQVVAAATEVMNEYRELHADVRAVRTKIHAKFSGLSEEDRSLLARLQNIDKLASQISFVYQAWEINKRQADLQNFITQFVQIEKDVMQSRESELANDVKEYYNQLSPGTSLEFGGFKIKEGKWRQAALMATAYNVEVNPTTMFSEAQGNCLGLSLYFSQRVKRNPGWAAILLDDPVQSMDEDHKQSLISVLATLQSERQIIIFTHDQSFKNSLSDQFASNPNYLQYEIFKSDTSPIPTIKVQLERYEQLVNHAELCADGPTTEREAGFVSIRKATERLVREIAEANNVHFSRRVDLEQKINQLSGNPIATEDIGTLHRIRSSSNPLAHDSSASAASGAIRSFIRDLNAIRTRYLGTTTT